MPETEKKTQTVAMPSVKNDLTLWGMEFAPPFAPVTVMRNGIESRKGWSSTGSNPVGCILLLIKYLYGIF